MKWSDEYALGVELIDKQHKELFAVTTRIQRILADGDSDRNRRASREAIKYLKSYTLQHFADEEEFQRSIGYAGYEEHKKEHENFTQRVLELEETMEAENYSPRSIQVFVDALTAWLLKHIMHMDQAIVGRGNRE